MFELIYTYRDLINGSFELFAGFFVLGHCRVLYRDKEIRGVSVVSIVFFWVWGIWNFFYYPSLGQMLSFYGSVFIVAANALYIAMILYYRRRRLIAA